MNPTTTFLTVLLLISFFIQPTIAQTQIPEEFMLQTNLILADGSTSQMQSSMTTYYKKGDKYRTEYSDGSGAFVYGKTIYQCSDLDLASSCTQNFQNAPDDFLIRMIRSSLPHYTESAQATLTPLQKQTIIGETVNCYESNGWSGDTSFRTKLCLHPNYNIPLQASNRIATIFSLGPIDAALFPPLPYTPVEKDFFEKLFTFTLPKEKKQDSFVLDLDKVDAQGNPIGSGFEIRAKEAITLELKINGEKYIIPFTLLSHDVDSHQTKFKIGKEQFMVRYPIGTNDLWTPLKIGDNLFYMSRSWFSTTDLDGNVISSIGFTKKIPAISKHSNTYRIVNKKDKSPNLRLHMVGGWYNSIPELRSDKIYEFSDLRFFTTDKVKAKVKLTVRDLKTKKVKTQDVTVVEHQGFEFEDWIKTESSTFGMGNCEFLEISLPYGCMQCTEFEVLEYTLEDDACSQQQLSHSSPIIITLEKNTIITEDKKEALPTPAQASVVSKPAVSTPKPVELPNDVADDIANNDASSIDTAPTGPKVNSVIDQPKQEEKPADSFFERIVNKFKSLFVN